jgi:hypothetical protein
MTFEGPIISGMDVMDKMQTSAYSKKKFKARRYLKKSLKMVLFNYSLRSGV